MIHRVSSPEDPRLAAYRYVADPAWLRAQGLFVAEGRRVVDRLLGLPRYAVQSLVLTPAAHAALGGRLAAATGSYDVYVCNPDVLRGITGFDFHRGCLALAARPAPLPIESFFTASRLLGLEGVGDPDNVGGLFRTAAAFGVHGVLLDQTSGDPLYRKAIRTSMGAALALPSGRAGHWLDTLQAFRREGYRIVALTPRPGAVPIADAAQHVGPADRLIALVGAEGPGLGRETLAVADLRLRIPIEAAVDSLNVVVAAGIALHALPRGRV